MMKTSIISDAVSVNRDDERYLSDYSDRDKKWDSHRSNTQDISQIYTQNSQFERYGARLNSCATMLAMQWSTPDENGEIKLKLKQTNFCDVRHCPVCAWRRSLRNVARFLQFLPTFQEEHPTFRWLFLTLTVKNCPVEQLRSTIQHMNESWKRLIQRQDWPAKGWVRTVEVTRSANGFAHPHFHVLLCVPAGYFKKNYVTKAEWARRWADAARLDYTPVVDIRTVKPKHEGQDLQAAVVETLKYGTKPADCITDPAFLYGITDQLHKLRFVATGGLLKGVLSDAVTKDEMIAPEGPEEAVEGQDEATDAASVFFDWRRDKRRYVKRQQ